VAACLGGRAGGPAKARRLTPVRVPSSRDNGGQGALAADCINTKETPDRARLSNEIGMVAMGDKNLMNEALVIPQGFGLTSIGEQFAFLRLPSKRSAKRISVSAEELLRNIADIHNQMIVGVIEKRTGAEFKIARDEVFANYVHVMRAVSDLARVLIPPQVLERLADESFSELESDFREHGDSFGLTVRDQAIFTVWTFRKINSLVQQITAKEVSESDRKKDEELSSKFVFYALWTRFHLDCLTVSLHCHKPIYPDARDLVADGLRAAVNAYAWAKQGFELRNPVAELLLAPYEWDDEDRELVESSMSDLSGEQLQ